MWRFVAIVAIVALASAAQSYAGSVIRLKTRVIDTSVVQSAAPSNSAVAAGPIHKIIQFDTPPSAVQIAVLEKAGATVLAFVPEDAVIVSIDAWAVIEVEGVRWAATIEPGDKISPDLPSAGVATVLIELHPDCDVLRGRSLVVEHGLELLENADLRGGHVLARGTAAQVAALAASDDVAYIFPAMAEVAEGAPVLACAGPATAFGAVGQYVATAGFGWDGVGRGSAALRYFISNTPPGYPSDVARATLARALMTWSKYVRVDFIAGASASATGTVNMSFASREHGDGFPFDGPGHVLAHSFYPAPLLPEPVAGDVHFDADEPWGALAGTDLFSVALHEAGHALGLGHSDKPSDVMYPYYRITSDLAAGDIAAIRTLYASRDSSSNPVPPTTPQPGAPLSMQFDAAPSSVSASSWTFSGRAWGGSGTVSVRWWNGSASGVATGSTAWRATVPLTVGSNSVVFTAVDSAGTQATATATVVRSGAGGGAPANPPYAARDTVAPVLSIRNPGSSYVLTSAATVTLSGTASDNVAVDRVTWTASGGQSGVAGGTTNWKTDAIPLNIGSNSIVVRAFDGAGNSSWRSLTVVRR